MRVWLLLSDTSLDERTWMGPYATSQGDHPRRNCRTLAQPSARCYCIACLGEFDGWSNETGLETAQLPQRQQTNDCAADDGRTLRMTWTMDIGKTLLLMVWADSAAATDRRRRMLYATGWCAAMIIPRRAISRSMAPPVARRVFAWRLLRRSGVCDLSRNVSESNCGGSNYASRIPRIPIWFARWQGMCLEITQIQQHRRWLTSEEWKMLAL